MASHGDSPRELDVDRSDELYGFAQRPCFEAEGGHLRANDRRMNIVEQASS
jgi:hypothetical protein